MTLDESSNWVHAAALERGEDPRPLIPEADAAARIAAAVGTHLQPAWLTDRALRDIAAKVVAHRGFVRSVFDELDADPKRLPERDVLFRQQATSSLSDEDHILERLHHLKAEESYLNACLTAMKSVYAPDYQPDARGEREDDARLSQEHHDEAANVGAPR